MRAVVRSDRRTTWLREVLLLTLLYVSYEWVRGNAPERKAVAFANAHHVQSLERHLHIDVELGANHLLLRSPWAMDAASIYYQLTHEVIVLGLLVWLWKQHRRDYALLRSTLVVLSLVSLAMYWMFPLAPPRFAETGVVDTMLVHPVLFAGMKSVTGLVNLYAAMPSVHVAWAVWCAVAITSVTESRWRHAAWAYPLATTVVVLGTGNHYMLDIMTGAALVLCAMYALTILHPHGQRSLRYHGTSR